MRHPDPGPHDAAASGWQASLRLRFAVRGARTALVERRHAGPLLVQKPLYPEGGICHVVVLHPPAGIAGGDRLAIDVDIEPGAHAVLTTPGAARWYKPLGPGAAQQVRLAVGTGAHLDWLPQENILFERARASIDTLLTVADGGSAIGWEAVVLGRRAYGETWSQGELRLGTRVHCGGHALWIEAARLDAGSPLRNARVGLDRLDVMGTLWAVGAGATAARAEQLAAALPCDTMLRAGATCLGAPGRGLLLVRVLGGDIEAVRRVLVSAWTTLREPLHGVAARPLRLWAT